MHFFHQCWRFIAVLAIASACGLFLILSASYLYLEPKLPPASQITDVQLQTPLRIYTNDDKLIAEFGNKRRTPLSFDEIPTGFVNAITAAEDGDFFNHGAVDIKGLARAAYELLRYHQIRSGGSTITMQVARNFFLSLNQTFLRKFNEIVLAIQIEQILSKEQILELYVNKIYLGHHAYGVAAAAKIYYGKPLNELSLAQLAMIAGLPKAPSAFNPISNPGRALLRRNWILSRMQQLGYISNAQRQLAAVQPVTARHHDAEPEINAGYAAETARMQVLDLLGDNAYTGGFRVYTTLDSDRQQAAISALRQGLQDYDKRHGWRGPKDHVDVNQLPALLQTPEAAGNNIKVSSASRQWATLLKPYYQVANLQVALVASVTDQQALVVLKDARQIWLDWDAIKWASKYRTANHRGAAPKKAADVVTPGDVVYLLPTNSGNQTQWRLSQIPSIQGSLISLDPITGAIQAMQGGYSFGLSHFNRAIQARRQPGSSFKPFVYTSALEHGMTPATLINDAPIVFDDDQLEASWRPTGDSGKFYGPVRLRVALYRSLNLASIRLLQRVGINNALDTLKQLHLPTSRIPKNLSIVLGSASLSPMEMATAYSTFANSGYHIRPWLIDRIVDSDDKIIWKAPDIILCDQPADSEGDCPMQLENLPEDIDSGGELAALKPQQDPSDVPPQYRYRTLNKQVAWLMYSIMQDVINHGTGRRALAMHYPGLAGKTGTTNDQLDAWFSGYSPDLVTTVWTGFDSPSTLGYREQGAVTALPIWINYMKAALPAKKQHHLPEPSGINAVLINSKTGLRARPSDSGDKQFEYFRSGKLPAFGSRAHESHSVSPEGIF